MRSSGISPLVLSLGLLFAAGPASADQVFADGFEECALGRWSTSTMPAPPEDFDALTPQLLATTLGACAPSLTAAEFRHADGSAPDAAALVTMANAQSAILRMFGTGGITALSGGTMTALGTGRARDADGPDFVDPTVGLSFERSGTAPASYLASHGGVLPSDACPGGSTTAHDSIALRLVFEVPDPAVALRFDWLFASADYPDCSCSGCSPFVDFFLALAQGTSPQLPSDRNVALVAGDPVSTVFVPFAHCTGCSAGTAALAGTGYTGHALTSWHTAEVAVVPAETLTLDLMIFDVGDKIVDSVVLLDSLRWVTAAP